MLEDMKSITLAVMAHKELTIKVRKAGKRFGQKKSDPYMNEDVKQVFPTVKCELE